MTCSYCHTQVSDNAKFCHSCGRAFEANKEVKSYSKWRWPLSLIINIAIPIAAFALARKVGLYAFVLIGPPWIGLRFSEWYSKRTRINLSLIKIIGWSNLITWFLPPLGLLTSTITFGLAKHLPRARTYRILASVGIVLALINGTLGFIREYRSALQESSSSPSPSDVAENVNEVDLADYNEGYKAGYVDGRSFSGKLGDSFSPPATEERREPYILGYMDGILKGCREGNYDCTEVENLLKQLYEEDTNPTNADLL